MKVILEAEEMVEAIAQYITKKYHLRPTEVRFKKNSDPMQCEVDVIEHRRQGKLPEKG